jgi:hypothetical protein
LALQAILPLLQRSVMEAVALDFPSAALLLLFHNNLSRKQMMAMLGLY